MDTREKAIEIYNLMFSERSLSATGQMDEYTKGSHFVLLYLDAATKDVVSGDLARELGVSTARIAALIKKLETQGLVERCRSNADKRCSIIRITVSGKEQANAWRVELLTALETLIDIVGYDDITELIRICQKIQNALISNKNLCIS